MDGVKCESEGVVNRGGGAVNEIGGQREGKRWARTRL